MPLPKPKSVPGLLLYGISFIAVVLFGRVAWVVVGQNIENVSADKGYDKLLSRHWTEIMAWMAENGFWLSLAFAFFLGATIALWANLGLQALFAKDAAIPSGNDQPEQRSRAEVLDALNQHINETYKVVGYAIGAQDRVSYDLALTQCESFLLQLATQNDFAIPELRTGGSEAGVLRTFMYLNSLVPPLQNDDDAEARERAAAVVPKLNAKTVTELRSDLGLSVYGQVPEPKRLSAPSDNSVSMASSDTNTAIPHYAYPKAVLRLGNAKIEGEASANGTLTKIVGSVSLTNEAYMPLEKCSILLVSIECDGIETTVNELLKRGNDSGEFTLAKSQSVRVNIVKREFTDAISNTPFLLLLRSREYPLRENSAYKLNVELRSVAIDTTLCEIEITTRDGRNFDLAITGQSLKPR